MHPALEGQIFGGGQGHTRRCDTLDGRVVGEVREDDGAVDGARAAEFLDEELRFLERDADGGEDDGEVRRVVTQHLRLTGDLGGQLRMRQEPEKIGSFWPRTRVLSPSIVEMPVWMNSLG